MRFVGKICLFVTTLMIFSERTTGGTTKEIQNNLPTCSFLLLEPKSSSSKAPLLKINFTPESNNVSCDVEKPETAGNDTGSIDYKKLVHCAGRNIQFNASKISQPGHFVKVQINCSSSSPLDFSFGKGVPFAGIAVSFGKNIIGPTKSRSWVAASFPEVIGVDNEGLEKYSGDYKFFSSESPLIEVKLKLDITQEQPAKKQVHKMCLNIFENRADCTVSGSKPNEELYFANVGGSNPTETKLLQSCLSHRSQSCGNKYRGSHCVQDRYCKKLSPIHQHGLIQCSSHNETQTVQYFTDLDADTHRVDGNDVLKTLPHADFIIRIEKENRNSTTEIIFPEDDNSTSPPDVSYDSHGCEIFKTVVHPLRMNTSVPIPLPTGKKYQLECHFIPYLLVPPVLWSIEFKNGTSQRIFADYGGNTKSEKKVLRKTNDEDVKVKIRSSHLEVVAVPEMKAVVCEAYYWNTLSVAKTSQAVTAVN